jgi:hypothetical protein
MMACPKRPRAGLALSTGILCRPTRRSVVTSTDARFGELRAFPGSSCTPAIPPVPAVRPKPALRPFLPSG